MMSDKETDASSILSLPRAFSYMSTSPSCTWSDTTSISTTRSTFEYSTSSALRSIGIYGVFDFKLNFGKVVPPSPRVCDAFDLKLNFGKVVPPFWD